MVVEIELPLDSDGNNSFKLVSDPQGNRLVVGFAVWRRLGHSPDVDYWRQHRAPAIDKNEGQ